MGPVLIYVGIFCLAAAISGVLCAVLKKYATSFGYMAIPKEDRWHRAVVPLGGGIAIFFSFIITVCVTLGIRPFFQPPSSILILIASAIFLLGFLDDRKNFRPTTKLLWQILLASIFMGDAGSMFIGFFTSTLVMTGVYPYTKALVSVLLLPVLILLIPIFDTALVTISRTLSGRRISQGGRDHVSHRLVALGLSE